jgi:hypothetical protein
MPFALFQKCSTAGRARGLDVDVHELVTAPKAGRDRSWRSRPPA